MKLIKKSYISFLIFISLIFIFIVNINATSIHNNTNNIKNNKDANITILTHGLGSTYSTWSHVDNDYVFEYNEQSIIAKLGQRLEGKLDIYIAKCLSTSSYELYYLSYNDYKNNNNEIKKEELLNTNNHIILIYNTSNKRFGLDNAYDEFHYMVDDFSSKYNEIYNELPTFNLIAHSRGGIINMLYCIDHPYNVKKVYSLGSPYGAINLAKPKTLLEATGLDSVVNNLAMDNGVNDILNEENNINIRNNWNNMLKEYNPNIEYYSFAYAQNIPFLFRLIDSLKDPNNNKHSVIESVNINIIESIIHFIDNNEIYIKTYSNFAFSFLSMIESLFNIKVYDNIFNRLGLTHEGIITKDDMQYFFDCFGYDKNTNQIMILIDGLVDVKSALGISFDDNIKYEGFNRYIKLLTVDDTYHTFASQKEPIVGHNVCVYDTDTIDFIVSNLKFNDNKNKNIEEFNNLKEYKYYLKH